jgi:hypothetical protein
VADYRPLTGTNFKQGLPTMRGASMMPGLNYETRPVFITLAAS